MCYPRNPRNINLFVRVRLGGPVTGATGKCFMCKSFMCLFCSLISSENKKSKRATHQGPLFQERKISPKRKFLDGYPADIRGSFARISRPKTSVRVLKSAQRGSFWDGYPADIRGSFARISRPKTSVRVLEILEKPTFGRGYP